MCSYFCQKNLSSETTLAISFWLYLCPFKSLKLLNWLFCWQNDPESAHLSSEKLKSPYSGNYIQNKM